MKLRHFLAVLAGAGIGLVLSLLLGLVMGIVIAVYFMANGMQLRQVATQLDGAHLSQSVPFLLATLGIGGFALLIAGFIAGWIARSAETLTGLITGIVSVIVSVPFIFLSPVIYPLWYNGLGIVVTIAPAVVGGYLAGRTVGQRPVSGPV